MNVFTDFHQTDLLYSLQLIFEKRLGYNLFRPIGLEWYKEGFWNIYPSLDTAEQYLGLRQGYQPKDKTLPLNQASIKFDEIYYCEDKHNNVHNTAITLNTFREIDVDIVIASIPQHIKPFKELAQRKNAKFIFQQGNMFSEILNNLHEIPNLLSSTNTFPVPSTCNAVFYHQEFDLDIFRPLNLPLERKISSFINVYHANGGFEDFMTLKAMLPEHEFKSYGAQNDNGVLNTTKDIASEMNRAMIVFHSKKMGDGFGHVLYNAYACGKPVITRLSDYKGKLGEELLTDMETCIDLDRHSFKQVCDIIQNMTPEQYQYMCQQAFGRFNHCVDYDGEEIKIREFLNKLI